MAASQPKLDPPLDEKGLPMIKGMSQAEIIDGFRLFFVNKQNEAMQFFDRVPDVPLMQLGKGACMFVWACIAFEEKDMDECIEQLKKVEKMSAKEVSRLTPSSGWLSFLPGSKLSRPSADLAHVQVINAEAQLIIATMRLLKESLMEKVKGAMGIRSAWKAYSSFFQVHAVPEGQADHLDSETRGAINFGMGTFNLVVSCLPPRVLKLVSFLGFPSDRQYGLRLLKKALEAGGVRSPVAAMALLAHHVFLQGSFCHGELVYGGQARTILDLGWGLFPDGGLFHMFEGRLKRMMKDTAGALHHFQRAAEVQSHWKPLVHLCKYEEAFSHMFLYQWAEAAAAWRLLYVENNWSKSFYGYCTAICLLRNGEEAEALRLLQSDFGQGKRINNKPLPPDRFVKRKVEQYVGADGQRLVLPHLEIMYFWNAFPQMGRDMLAAALAEVTDYRTAHWDTASVDDRALLSLLAGTILGQLGKLPEAEACLHWVEENRKAIKQEISVVPYARYELAMLWHEAEGVTERVVAELRHAMAYSHDFNFDLQLNLRIHLALYQFQHPPAPEDQSEVEKAAQRAAALQEDE